MVFILYLNSVICENHQAPDLKISDSGSRNSPTQEAFLDVYFFSYVTVPLQEFTSAEIVAIFINKDVLTRILDLDYG